MTSFDVLKLVHVSCALFSVIGFVVRGYWMVSANPMLQHPAAKTLPHIIDTFLLATAVAMLVSWRVSPLQVDWLSAKLCALLVYIALGMVAMRFGKTLRVRFVAWLLALSTACYIISVAYLKTPWGFMQLLTQ